MITNFDHFSDVIALWPSAAAMATDLNLKSVTVRAWKSRGIPAQYWSDIVCAARVRGVEISIAALADLAARSSGRPARLTRGVAA